MAGSELLLKYQAMPVPVTNDCGGPKPRRDVPLPSPFLGVHRSLYAQTLKAQRSPP